MSGVVGTGMSVWGVSVSVFMYVCMCLVFVGAGMLATIFVCLSSIAMLLRACERGFASGPSGVHAIDTSFVNFFNGLCILGFMCSCQATAFPVRFHGFIINYCHSCLLSVVCCLLSVINYCRSICRRTPPSLPYSLSPSDSLLSTCRRCLQK